MNTRLFGTLLTLLAAVLLLGCTQTPGQAATTTPNAVSSTPAQASPTSQIASQTAKEGTVADYKFANKVGRDCALNNRLTNSMSVYSNDLFSTLPIAACEAPAYANADCDDAFFSDRCRMIKAVYEKDSKHCEELSNEPKTNGLGKAIPSLRENCYHLLALAKADPKLCEKITHTGLKQACGIGTTKAAIIQKDTPQECMKLVGKDKYETGHIVRGCIRWTAFTSKKASDCQVNPEELQVCLEYVAAANKDETQCPKLLLDEGEGFYKLSEESRNEPVGYCYQYVAMAKQDAKLCEKISKTSTKENCYEGVASVTLNKELCEKTGDKTACAFKISGAPDDVGTAPYRYTSGD